MGHTIQDIRKEVELTNKVLNIIENQLREAQGLGNDGLCYSDIQSAVEAVIIDAISYEKGK